LRADSGEHGGRRARDSLWLTAYGLRCRSDDIEDLGPDSGKDSRVQTAGGPFVEEDLGRARENAAQELRGHGEQLTARILK
jgi:hypothetical protein